MKKLILSVLAALGFAAANAGAFPEGYTPLKYISSKSDGTDYWASNQIGPYLQIYNQDKSPFVLGADDVVETKFLFNTKDTGACVFCVRGSSSGKFVLMRAGNSPYQARFDYGTVNNALDQNKIKLNNTDVHTVTASKSGITVDGTTIVPTASTYEPTSNALLLFCCDNSGNGIANAGNKGTIRMYYFRVKDGSGNLRLNLVPMLRVADSKPGLYDAVSGQFFTNKSANGEFTYGSAGMMDRIAAATAFCGATDPAAEGGDYVFKDGNDYIHVFSSVGEGKSFTVTKDRTAQILVVGGGQGGARSNSGTGGNAGGFTFEEAVPLSAGEYTVTVGAGGVGGPDKDTPGQAGGDSSFVLDASVIASAAGGSSTAYNTSAGGNGADGNGAAKSGYNGGAGGAAKLSGILGWTEAFAGGGGGGSQIATEGAGGSATLGGTTWTVGGRGGKGNGSGDSGVTGTGSGGGGAAVWTSSGGQGSSGIVILRLSKVNVEISGEITMDDWTEGETASEPSGLTVTPEAAQSEFAYKYYANADCTEAIAKPSKTGVYYVRGEVAESDLWNPAVSAAVEFKILPAGGGKEIVKVPTITTEFTYTGAELSPVEAGEHYTLSGDTAKMLAGNYMATLALEDTEKYMWSDTLKSDPKVVNWTIAKAENKWTVEPSIDKTVWKSTEKPGEVTPPIAQFGEAKAQIARKLNGEYADWEDWDGETMPTEKGKYKIRWQVAELADGYTSLESWIEFLIDYRYEPTHPFMYTMNDGATWSGADTFKGAVDGITGSGYVTATIELCQDVTDTTGSNMSYRHITLRSNPDDGRIYKWTRSSDGFSLWNGSTLTIQDVVIDLAVSGNLFSSQNGGSVTLKSGAALAGTLGGALCGSNSGSGAISFTLDGGALSGLTISGTPFSGAATLKSGVIENCTVSSGAIIAVGDKTLNLSNVTITNNVTSAGAITVGATGIIKVSGDVIVKGNKVGDDEKNIVLKNAENLQMVGDLGASASVGVSYGEAGDQFGVYENEKGDAKTAAKFFNDAKPTLMGKARNDMLFWAGAAGDQFGVYVDGDPKSAAKFFNDAKPALMGKARDDKLFWAGAGLMLLIK